MPGWNDPITWGVFVYVPAMILAGIIGVIALLWRGLPWFERALDLARFGGNHCNRAPSCGHKARPADLESIVDHCLCFCAACDRAKQRRHERKPKGES